MLEREKQLRRRLRDDFPFYTAKCLKIRPKPGGLIPFVLNRVQRHLHDRIEAQLRATGRVRALILKARQPGCSTYVEGRFYWKVTHGRGMRAFILSHRQEATDNLFGMASRFYRHSPEAVRPSTAASNARELVFDRLESGYRVGTAGSADVGRSDTIQLFHGSEVAFWPNAADHMAGVLQAVPSAAGTEIVLESTGNGIGGLFYNMCKATERGEGTYQLIFIPWFWHEEYRAADETRVAASGAAASGAAASGAIARAWRPPPAFVEYGLLHRLDQRQLRWAYDKNAELAVSVRAAPDEICWKFRQEYPATADEAFQAAGHESFIRPESVLRARRTTAPDQSHAALVLGVDVARGGGDRTRLIDRQGRVMGSRINRTIDTDDLMEVAGIVARTIEEHGVDMAFIDATGLGAGVYDRLAELGFRRRVRGVNFAAASSDGRAHANKRAEMWAGLRDWLEAPGGADLADDDTLQSHLCAPGYKFDSSGRLLLERKDDIRKRLGFSPDGGDAAALTFAAPVRRDGPPRRRPATASRRYPVLG